MIHKDALEIDAALLRRRRILTHGLLALLRANQFVSAREIAARCNVSEVSSGRWLAGKLVPAPMARAILLDAYGIPVDSWTRPVARFRPECSRQQRRGSKDAR